MWGGSSPAFLLPAAAPTEAATTARAPVPLGTASAASEAHAAPGAGASGVPSASAPWGCIAASLVVGAVAARASQRRGGVIRRRAAPSNEAGQESAASALAAKEGGVSVPNAVGRAGLLRSCGIAGAGSLVVPLAPPSAYAKSWEEATKSATSLGLADLISANAPEFGWSVVCEPVGVVPDAQAGINKVGGEPLVATWYIPPLWIITKPTIDFNGSSGTLAANDFGKGDSATLFVDQGSKVKFQDWKKDDYAVEIRKALSQKGKGFVDELKVGTVRDGPVPGYKIFDYVYNLESQAGFNISRGGIASITQIGDKGNTQMLWTGVVGSRFAKMQEDLLKMAESFRIGKVPKGIKLEGFREFQTLDQVTSEAGGVRGVDDV